MTVVMTKFHKTILVIIGLILTTGCSRSFEVIRDIRELPQDHRLYIREDLANKEILPDEDRLTLQQNYNRCFFSPWHQEQSAYNRADAERFFNIYLKKVLDDGKKTRRQRSFAKNLIANGRLEGYPNIAMRAITVRHEDARGLPTARLLPSPKRPGAARGVSFDRLQVSSIPANTPVFISHLSRDRKWCLAETGFALGWMPIRDLAPVDETFIRAWERGSYVTFVKDGVPIHDRRGYGFKTAIGTLLPASGEDGETWKILVAAPGKKGRAMIRECTVPKSVAVKCPLPLDLHHLALIANEFVGEPYGWGGKGGKRDCSSMIRDLFTPFGIWLPRHSADQASEGGYYVDLSGQGREEKQAAIIARGVPYLTLLWIKGHIMLYVGEQNGEPLVFHNFWSVRTTDIQGRNGKKVIGRTAITTLHPGRELQAAESSPRDLLDAIQGMTFLVRPASETGASPSFQGEIEKRKDS